MTNMGTKRNGQRGSAMLAVLALIVALAIAIAAVLQLAVHDVKLAGSHNEFKRVLAVAEAGLEQGAYQLRELLRLGGTPDQSQLGGLLPPDIDGFRFQAPNGNDAYQVTVDGSPVQAQPLAAGRWAGLVGTSQAYAIRAGVVGGDNTGAVLRQSVQWVSLPVCRFAGFYQPSLEVLPTSELTIQGPVHTNADLFVGSGSLLHLAGLVRASGGFYCRTQNGMPYPVGQVLIDDASGVARDTRIDGRYLDHDYAQWAVQAVQRWGGRVLDSAHAVPPLQLLIPPGSQPRDIIERALPTDSELLAAQRLENRARLIAWRDASGYPNLRTADGNAATVLFWQGGTEQAPTEAVAVAYTVEYPAANSIRFRDAPEGLGAERRIEVDTFVIPVEGPVGPVTVTTRAGGYESRRFMPPWPATTRVFDDSGFEAEIASVAPIVTSVAAVPAPVVVPPAAGAPVPVAAAGQININPNNSADNEFALSMADGTTVTRDNIHNNTEINSAGTYVAGSATNVHVKPKGNGNQNGFLVNGVAYSLANGKAYDISGGGMTVRLYNANPSRHGNHYHGANGQWWINITCGSATVLEDGVAIGQPAAVPPPVVPPVVPPAVAVASLYTITLTSLHDTNPLEWVTFDFAPASVVKYAESYTVTTGGNRTGGPYALAGDININPSNSPNNEFNLTKAGGGVITRDDLHSASHTTGDGTFYQGAASSFFVKPKGNGNQNTWIVDGVAYPLSNGKRYTITGNLQVRVYNDHVKNGKAMGHWYITTGGTATSIVEEGAAATGGTGTTETITGRVDRSTNTGLLRALTVAPFADWREGGGTARTMHALDLDVSILAQHPAFVADSLVYAYSEYRPMPGYALFAAPVVPSLYAFRGPAGVPGQAVRILNGAQLPGRLSFATNAPLYIRGDYNSVGDPQPSMVCGDAVSVLSTAWTDATGWAELGSRPAAATAVCAVILGGNVPSTPEAYSGGYENLLRLGEDWGGASLTFQGSLACLWTSALASAPYRLGGNCFQPPGTLSVSFHAMYQDPDNDPPGVPRVYAFEMLRQAQDSWTEDEQ